MNGPLKGYIILPEDCLTAQPNLIYTSFSTRKKFLIEIIDLCQFAATYLFHLTEKRRFAAFQSNKVCNI